MSEASLRDAVALLEAGDWQAAHPLTQTSDSALASWAHGIVHLIEGDISNARYWYAQAGRSFPEKDAIDAEIAGLKVALHNEF